LILALFILLLHAGDQLISDLNGEAETPTALVRRVRSRFKV
jgi:hypothetical protein